MFVLDVLFQLHVMFVSKARSQPLSGAPNSGSGLTHKYKTSLERPVRDQHSSLIQAFINFCHKKFYSIEPWVRLGGALSNMH
jgi:hypothetical protein